jgi:hypothetical protein
VVRSVESGEAPPPRCTGRETRVASLQPDFGSTDDPPKSAFVHGPQVANLPDLDFQDFVADRKARQPGASVGGAHAYAYVSDRATRATFERVKPIELAVAAGVRVFKHVG